ncbi:MAG: hypothetical protein F4X47_06580, partial [Gammaproteobacteria bacterium]|nr:hypothetical protein [Gammaproteobacteria bacterium]
MVGALNGFIGHAADGLAHDVRLNVAIAPLNVGGGYSLIAGSLDKLHSVRLLIGAEPGPPGEPTQSPANCRHFTRNEVSCDARFLNL